MKSQPINPGPMHAQTATSDTAGGGASGQTERLIELLFFAYRDFTADADALLGEMDFGRAHHRVLHFVDRKPGLTVAELLEFLGITKQSLSRVLKQLVDDGYVRQAEGAVDRRRRELHLTARGQALIGRLREPQSRRILAALEQSGLDPDDAAAFLYAMTGRAARGQMAALKSGQARQEGSTPSGSNIP